MRIRIVTHGEMSDPMLMKNEQWGLPRRPTAQLLPYGYGMGGQTHLHPRMRVAFEESENSLMIFK